MIPKKLKVFSTQVTINEVNGLTAEVGNLGQYSSIGNRIDIDSSLPEEIKQQTVLHEIIELVNHHLEIGIPEHRMITQIIYMEGANANRISCKFTGYSISDQYWWRWNACKD